MCNATRTLAFISILLLTVLRCFAAPGERQLLPTLTDRLLGTRSAQRAAQFNDLPLQLISDNLFDVFGAEGVVTFNRLPRSVKLLPVAVDLQRISVSPGVISLRDSKPLASIAGKTQLLRPIDWAKINFSGVAVTIDAISKVSHGNYALTFHYSITRPDQVKLPLRFQPVIDGDAGNTLCYAMYAHNKGLADNLPGYIPLVYTGLNTSLKSSCDNVGLKVFDGEMHEVVTITVPLKYEFTKRYVDITRDNIRDYLALPGKAKMSMAVSGNAPDTLQAQGTQYLMEPGLLLCKTSAGNYAKALVGLEDGNNGTRHLDIWDARCYAKDQGVFNATPFMPTGFDSNIEYIQLFGNGGFVFTSNNFDFDLNGENAGPGEGDITLQVNNGGNDEVLITHPLARIAF